MSQCGRCVDGLIWIDESTALPCKECLGARNRGEHAKGYGPGGLTHRALMRAMGRRGGIASGKARKPWRRGKPTPARLGRQKALALHYRHRQFNRWKFGVLYRRHFPTGNKAGELTLWMLYESHWRLYRRGENHGGGQHFRTTNKQRSDALGNRGRGRHIRTIQRGHRKLEAMGLLLALHDRRGGATPGNRDRLVIEIRSPILKNVMPPLEAGSRLRRLSSCVSNSKSPPATPAENEHGPSTQTPAGVIDEPQTTGTEIRATGPLTAAEDLQRQLSFDELKRQAGWSVPRRWLCPGADGDG